MRGLRLREQADTGIQGGTASSEGMFSAPDVRYDWTEVVSQPYTGQRAFLSLRGGTTEPSPLSYGSDVFTVSQAQNKSLTSNRANHDRSQDVVEASDLGVYRCNGDSVPPDGSGAKAEGGCDSTAFLV